MVNQRAKAIQKLLRLANGHHYMHIGAVEAREILLFITDLHKKLGCNLADDYGEAVTRGVWPTHCEPAADDREAHSPTQQLTTEDVDHGEE